MYDLEVYNEIFVTNERTNELEKKIWLKILRVNMSLQKLSKAHITKDKVKYEEDKETIWNEEYNCDCMKAGG